LETVYPAAGEHVEALLKSPQLIPPTVLADAMIEDMADLPGRLILALDDYHEVTNEDVHTFVSRLVQYQPSNVHLVLISRGDPPLRLSRLRGRGELNELHAEDLQFSVEETQLMLERLTGEVVEASTAAELEERTEGWPIGLQLAALARQRGESTAELAVRLGREGHGYATEFLMDEVLTRQPPAVRDFLLRTSLLERLSDPLVRAVLSTGASQDDAPAFDAPHLPELERLSRANLFLIPLDRDRSAFRYHHLFRDLLRLRLAETVSAADIRSIHQRAAAWLAGQGLIEDAIHHALAAGEEAAAARIVETNVHQMFNREDWRAVSRWIDLLPESQREQPAMLVARSWILNFQFRMRTMRNLALEAEARLSSSTNILDPNEVELLQSQIDLLKAIASYWTGDGQTTLSLLMKASPHLHPDMLYVRGIWDFYYVVGQGAVGEAGAAIAYAERALERLENSSDTSKARLLLAMCGIYIERGQMQQFQRAGQAVDRLAARSYLPASASWAGFSQGLAAYEVNDLALAEQATRNVIRNPFESNVRASFESYIILALTLEARGRSAEADDILRQMQIFLVEVDAPGALALVEATHARLAAGRRDTQISLVSSPLPTVEAARADLRLSFLVSPLLSRVRNLLVQGAPAGLDEADSILKTSQQAAEELFELRRLAEVLALKAWHQVLCGRMEDALDSLERSLALAEPGRLVRTFVDCSPILTPLLQTLSDRGVRTSYIQSLLRAFKGASAADDIRAESSKLMTTDVLMRLRSVLTNREMDVLVLLEQRLSNQEIADRLFIETYTVKKHLQNIYHKLGVDNRRAAIAYAQQVGLLS
jgi:LuxR family maltose regulon positive regulatory protein